MPRAAKTVRKVLSCIFLFVMYKLEIYDGLTEHVSTYLAAEFGLYTFINIFDIYLKMQVFYERIYAAPEDD